MARDFSSVTEVTGNRLTREAISMMYTRYRFAASRIAGRDVLEVGCGVGQGLGILQRSARRLVGGDFTFDLVSRARQQYRDRLSLLCMDAQALPFRDASFDAAILYEAIYYLPKPERFLRETRRVLRGRGGCVMVCSANPQWSDFNPSPHSIRYYSPSELAALCKDAGFEPHTFGAYRVTATSFKSKLVSVIRRVAVGLHLMPSTMKGKEKLKRMFYGKLLEMPAELNDERAEAEVPTPSEADRIGGAFKVVFVVATVP